MLVEQAVFTSAQTRNTQGYHLVARSSGIDEASAQELIRWSPTHSGLVDDDVDASSLNFYTIGERWLVLSRSIYGGPEYSGRGGFRIVTYIVMMRPDQLIGYRYNPMVLASSLLSRGLLRFQSESASQLDPLNVPESSPLASYHSTKLANSYGRQAERIVDTLRRGDRVVVLGAEDPAGVAAEVEQRLNDQERASVSFATGMKPSVNRPFKVQFLKEVPDHQQKQLRSQGVVCCRV